MDEYDDMTGARFQHKNLRGAEFEDTYLNGARFNDVILSGARISNAILDDVQINADIRDLVINGVDVVPLVEAELNRRYPDRIKMRPERASGYLEAWDTLDRLWGETVERARRLPPERLHERVDGEWSFIETLRHLVFATDAWVLRAYLGDPSPYHPLDLPHDEMSDIPGVPRDREARPSLDEILAVRADRRARVREVFASLTEEDLESTTEPVLAPGYPESESFPVRRCLQCVLIEEWEHRLYAERDLAVLEAE